MLEGGSILYREDPYCTDVGSWTPNVWLYGAEKEEPKAALAGLTEAHVARCGQAANSEFQAACARRMRTCLPPDSVIKPPGSSSGARSRLHSSHLVRA